MQITRSSTSSAGVTGYLEIVPGNENNFVFGCNWRALPILGRANFPLVQATQFANVGSIASIFGTNTSGSFSVPPAVMGTCGLHDGVQGCTQGTGSTIDLVPLFVEYCIDGRGGSELGQCDTAKGYPVHSPVAGVAARVEGDGSVTLIIGPNPLNPAQTLEINFVHMVVASKPPGPVASGQQLGTICRETEKTFGNNMPCTFREMDTPVHLAFQPRIRDGKLILPAPPNDVLSIIAAANCLYDDWKNVNGNPTRNFSSTFAVCS